MRLPWVLTAVLALLLLLTNGAWLYASLDQGVTLAYRDQAIRDHCNALETCLAILPRVAIENRERVLAGARQAAADPSEFEKDGATWLGSIGLHFAGDRLINATPAWEPFECPE